MTTLDEFARTAVVLEAGHEMVAAVRKAAGDDLDPFRLASMFIGAALHLIEDAHGRDVMFDYARMVLASLNKVEGSPDVSH